MGFDLESVKVFVWPPGPYRFYTPGLLAEVRANRFPCIATASLQCPLCGQYTAVIPDSTYGDPALRDFGPGRFFRFACGNKRCLHSWDLAYEDNRLWILKEGLA